jgi:isopropylmalate/homocitrate/citramalate synthase
MVMDRISIFDTTLRDGEKSQSAAMTREENGRNKLLVKREKQVPEALTVAR